MINQHFSLPIDDDLLKRHNFFELYPLDGGGRFIFQEVFGTIDDQKICEKVLKKNMLSGFGTVPNLNFKKFERWRSIEKSCWLNKFYFLVSMARVYWLTGEETIAKLVKNTILNFIRNCPHPEGKKAIGEHINFTKNIMNGYNRHTYEENQEDETDVRYIW